MSAPRPSAAAPDAGSSRAQPAAIRPGLLALLAVALGLTVWMAMQEDESDLAAEPRAGTVERRPGGGGAAATPGAPGPDGATGASPAGAPPAGPRRVFSAVTGRGGGTPADAPGPSVDAAAERLAQTVALLPLRADFQTLSAPGRRAWSANLPPPPPPVAPPPPPPPQAPRFPYQMVGRWEEPLPAAAAGSASDAASGAASNVATNAASGASPGRAATLTMAVISGPQNTWVLKAGDVIEGQWRVDEVQPRAVKLTYLPLSQTQTVSMKSP